MCKLTNRRGRCARHRRGHLKSGSTHHLLLLRNLWIYWRRRRKILLWLGASFGWALLWLTRKEKIIYYNKQGYVNMITRNCCPQHRFSGSQEEYFFAVEDCSQKKRERYYEEDKQLYLWKSIASNLARSAGFENENRHWGKLTNTETETSNRSCV